MEGNVVYKFLGLLFMLMLCVLCSLCLGEGRLEALELGWWLCFRGKRGRLRHAYLRFLLVVPAYPG